MKESDRIQEEVKALLERHKCESAEFVAYKLDLPTTTTEEIQKFCDKQIAELDELRQRYEDALMKEYGT